MKNWKLYLCLILLVVFTSFGLACQQSGGPAVSELRGAIQKDNNNGGLHIRSGGKLYTIESQKDLSELAGKMVTLKGTVSEEAGKITFTVDLAVEK
jgi:hypothetical protein